jgi:hypothetical protein
LFDVHWKKSAGFADISTDALDQLSVNLWSHRLGQCGLRLGTLSGSTPAHCARPPSAIMRVKR